MASQFVKLPVSGGGGGSGTVTSVDVNTPGGLLVSSGGPITSSGIITLSLATQAANTVFAGPTSGGAVAPTFRALVSADIPSLAYLTSINADTTAAQLLTVGTAGTDFAITNPGGGSHVFNLPTASASNRGALSSADWSTFNGKQAAGNYITALTGDVTASGPGSAAATIAVGAVTDTKGSLAGKPAVAVVSVSNLTLSGLQTIDGVSVAANTLVLLSAQTAGAENGPWQAQVGAWTRPTWYPSGGTTQAFQFITCLVRLGTTYQGSVWRQTAGGAITIDTTSTTWVVTPHALNSNTVNGTLPAAQMPALTGDVTTTVGTVATTIAANAVTNAKAAQMANNTIKSNVSGGTANAADNTFATLAATAVTVSSNANAKGSANTFALSDHTHQLTASSASQDSLPQFDGSAWQPVFPESILNPSRALVLIDDFVGADLSSAGNGYIGQLSWTTRVSGTAAAASVIATTAVNHPGVCQLATGTTTTGTANIYLGPTGTAPGSFILGGGAIHIEAVVQFPTLGTAGQQYTSFIGLADADNTTSPANSVGFFYNNGGTGDFFVIQASKASTTTSQTLATAVVAGSWFKLGIDINAGATSISFSINGSTVGTAITTNIPNVAAVGPVCLLLKSAGTTARTTLIDYFYLNQRFTTPR